MIEKSTKPCQVQLLEHETANTDDRQNYVIRQRMIKAVVTVLTSVVIALCVLGGIWLLTEQHKTTLQYALKLHGFGTQEATEEVFADVTENIVQYHVTTNESRYWILKDFNRGLKITKMEERSQSKCLISVLDKKHSTHPADITTPDNLDVYNDADSRDTDGVEMTSVSASPVADRSLLGSAASRLCQGAPLHWEHPICPATHKTESEDVRQRHKRSNVNCGMCACDHTVCITCGGLTQRFYIEGGKLQCSYTFNFATCPSNDYNNYYFIAECPDLPSRAGNRPILN